MSRFADPNATVVLPLGECQCPDAPHEQDEAVVRYQLGASALGRIGRAQVDGAVHLDPFAAYRQTVIESVVSWNLRDDRGDVPINARTVAELDIETLKALAEGADKLIESNGVLPNASGAPSRASSRRSASPSRPKRQTPTT